MPIEKRIVFEHTRGPLKGLREIMGPVSDLLSNPEDILPDHAAGFEAQGRLIEFASLVEVKKSFALYRESQLDSEGRHYPERV